MLNRENTFSLSISIIVFTFLFSGCKKDTQEPKNSPATDVFYKQMTSLVLEVVYEPGAEPYDFKTTGENIWSLAETNLESLFAGRSLFMDVIVPNGLAGMKQIPDQNKTGFTLSELNDIAEVYRTTPGNETTGNIFIIFLNGHYQQADTLVTNIAGLNIVGTTITAIFKPLINASYPTKRYREFVEQSVLIHETGHALGLVNNGVPITSEHHDSEHGSHCTNQDCVMYWQNESTTAVNMFIQSYLQGNNVIIFGEECLKDTREYFPQ